jgi:DNA-binding winged helix-turn-helix (wHTH) protein
VVSRSTTFRFDDFEVDEARSELSRRGERIPLHATPFRLLVYLLQNSARLCTKDEVLRAVWPDTIVSDDALSSALKDLRKALGDDGSQQRYIRTERKRGYRFAAPVQKSLEPEALDWTAKRALYGVPRHPSMHFLGRDAELSMLREFLGVGSRLSLQASVEGLAGIGKTELALQLAYLVAADGRFTGGVFWLDAEIADLTPIWADTIAEQLAVGGGSPKDRCSQVLRRIEASGCPTLIVLDNVESWTPLSQPAPLPAGPHVHLLVTTRRRNLAGSFFRHVDLGFLREPYDQELLERTRGRSGGPGLAELLRYCAGHALALELAGAFLATHPGETPESYLKELEGGVERIEIGFADRVRYEHTLSHALRTVWNRATEREREAWWICSFFEPVPASRAEATSAGVDLASLRRLEELHLTHVGPDQCWTMHRLTRDFAQKAVPPSERGLDLLLCMGPNFFHRHCSLTEMKNVYRRASEIAHAIGQAERLFSSLEALWQITNITGDHARSGSIAEEMLEISRKTSSDRHSFPAALAMGSRNYYAGRMNEAASWLEVADPRDSTESFHQDTFVHPFFWLLWYRGLVAVLRGFPDDALSSIEEAAYRSETIGDPKTVGAAVLFKALIHLFREEHTEVQLEATKALALSAREGIPVFGLIAKFMSALACDYDSPSEVRSRIDDIRLAGLNLLSSNFRLGRTFGDAAMCRAFATIGADEGLPFIDQSLVLTRKLEEHFMEPEIWRARAILLSDSVERVNSLKESARLAEEHGSRWWLLRTLCELTRNQELPGAREARARLEILYSELPQGRGLRDMQRAEGLLM